MQERKHSISDTFLFFLFLGALALFCYQSLQSMQSLSSQADSLAENPKVILIDPGHGGDDRPPWGPLQIRPGPGIH